MVSKGPAEGAWGSIYISSVVLKATVLAEEEAEVCLPHASLSCFQTRASQLGAIGRTGAQSRDSLEERRMHVSAQSSGESGM